MNDFLYMPTEVLTESLSANEFFCADNTIEVTSIQETYERDEVATIKTKINSIATGVNVILKVYDPNSILKLKKTTTNSGSDAMHLIDLDDFEPGIYTATVEFGVDGSKDQVKFGVAPSKPFEQEKKNMCQVYLLYDEQKGSLIIFAKLYDPSGSRLDSFQIFVDRNGDGKLNLAKDDIRYYVSKTEFGGREIVTDEGWVGGLILDDKHKKKGNARINKVHDGFEILVEVPSVSKNFRLATEQTDVTFVEYKKTRYPQNSFSTIPLTWAEVEFVDNSPIKYKAEKWIPNEIVANQNIDINLILVGDEWTDSQKKYITSKLEKNYEPLVWSELHLAGMKYNYFYNFISAPEDITNDLFELMKQNAEHVNPFYGENQYDEPWGIASWVKTNHTEWVSLTQQRYEVDYKLVDAQLVDDFLYENLISQDSYQSRMNKPNSANLIFISDDMDDVDFIHNYKLSAKDPSTEGTHQAVGLMGYGGEHNSYFFDLYAVPWDPWQGLFGFYDPNLINEYTNFHDLETEEQRNQLFVDYINNATSLIISPSYVYPPVYKTHYLIDLLIVAEPSSTANNVLIDHFIEEEKIISELERIIPNSTWELNLTLERINSRDLPQSVKDVLKTAKKVPLISEKFGPVISILDSEDVTKQLVSWGSTRESTNFRDFRDVKESVWNIPVMVMIGEGNNRWYIDGYGQVGLAAAHPDDETQPCCALALSSDYSVWHENVGVTDLVIHEVGHVMGLMHPFQGYNNEKEEISNNYFNWYASPMIYGAPPRGCGVWYMYQVEGSCGISDTHFTHFEKDAINKGIVTFLIKSAENNIYRSILEQEKQGTDPDSLPYELQNTIQGIESKINQAKNSFLTNDLYSNNGALQTALAAALESQDLASEYSIEYKVTERTTVEIQIPAWIKDQGKWWVEGSISDNEFINAIQYLIKERIIVLPPVEREGAGTPTDMPDWVKNTVNWWSLGKISDQELVGALQFLIKEGIIVIP